MCSGLSLLHSISACWIHVSTALFLIQTQAIALRKEADDESSTWTQALATHVRDKDGFLGPWFGLAHPWLLLPSRPEDRSSFSLSHSLCACISLSGILPSK